MYFDADRRMSTFWRPKRVNDAQIWSASGARMQGGAVACACILIEVIMCSIAGNNVNRPAYNQCIGTAAESPKQGMRADNIRSRNQL